MRQRGYPETYARRIFEQIRGFGEYGHAASFALVACCSACHEPAAFTCALLNSRPMGFYAAAQLVQDCPAPRSAAVDVGVGDWDCTLGGRPALLRLALRMVKGLSWVGAARITAALPGGAQSQPLRIARPIQPR